MGVCPNNFNGNEAIWRHDGRWVTTVTPTYDDYCDIINHQGCGQLYNTHYHRFTPSAGTAQLVLTTATRTVGAILSGDDAIWRECDGDPFGVTNTKTRIPATLVVVSNQTGCNPPVGFGAIGNAPSFTVSRRP